MTNIVSQLIEGGTLSGSTLDVATADGGFSVAGNLVVGDGLGNVTDSGLASGDALNWALPFSVAWRAGQTPNNTIMFVAQRAMQIVAIIGAVEIANGATATVSIKKSASGTAGSAGDLIHTGSFDADGAASFNQSLTLTGLDELGRLMMATGERLVIQASGTFTASVASLAVYAVAR